MTEDVWTAWDRVLDDATAGEIDDRFAQQLHPVALHLFRAAIGVALRRPNVTTVAMVLGCSPRQLQRVFASACLPPPQRLVMLARWLVVASLMTKRPTPSRVIARALGFSSTQALCRAVRREIGISVQQLRDYNSRDRLAVELIEAYGAHDQWSCRKMETVGRDLATAQGRWLSYARTAYRADTRNRGVPRL